MLLNLAVESFGGWSKVHEHPAQYVPLVVACMQSSSRHLIAAELAPSIESLAELLGLALDE
ncbi:MAG: hypothetical protein QM586_06815 [Xenophilus sp.]